MNKFISFDLPFVEADSIIIKELIFLVNTMIFDNVFVAFFKFISNCELLFVLPIDFFAKLWYNYGTI